MILCDESIPNFPVIIAGFNQAGTRKTLLIRSKMYSTTVLLIVSAFLATSNAFVTHGLLKTSVGSTMSLQATVSAAMVKELREKAGAGMMDCKKALNECDGNVDAAVDWLRKKGLAAVQKKAGRTAAMGFVNVAQAADGKAAAIVEMNCETDFAARNEMFMTSVKQMGQIAVAGAGTRDALLASGWEGESATVNDEVTRLVATIGENMNFRRVTRLEVDSGLVSTYMHMAAGGEPTLGKIGCAVALESGADQAKLAELGKNLCLHVAAQAPIALSVDDMDPAAVEREKQVLIDQAKESGKPEAAIEKMVEGRLRKFYEESCMLEQGFVMEPKKKVKDLIAEVSKEVGADITLTSFARLELGEGIDKTEED